VALKYIGDGTYILGVPARDLTEEEEREHGALIRAQEQATGVKLYEKAKADKPKPEGEKG
jgi:hypothetical protein